MLRSTLLEEKQFLGKILVCDFHVSEISFKINGHETKTNKWLHTFEWEQIYEKLDDILKKTKELNLIDLDMSSFRIDNYIEVFLKKASVHGKCFPQLLGRKDHDITPVYLKVYIKRLSLCKEELPEIIEVRTEPSPPSSQPLEYDPTINGNAGNTLAYTPSNISNSEEAYTPSKIKAEQSVNVSPSVYVPKPISPSKRDYIVSPEFSASTLQYKASKISPTIRSESPKKKKIALKKEETEPRHDRPKRAASTKKEHSKRPSRSDDEGEDTKDIKKKRENVNIKPRIPSVKTDTKSGDKERHRHRDDNRDREREPSSCSSTSSSSSRNKSSKDKHRDKSKDIRNFMSPISEKSKPSNSDLKVSEIPFPLTRKEEIEKERQKIQELRRAEAIFQELNVQAENEKKRRPKPPRDEYLTLKYKNVEDLCGTFEDYKSILDPMVQNFIENPLSKIKGVNGLLQCKTDGIIPEKMLLGILSFLNDKYESKYELSDLFMTQLIPEWLLNLFAKKYKMNRENAILQLNYQEEPIDEM